MTDYGLPHFPIISKKRDENMTSRQLGIFDELRGVWKRGETLSRVFQIIFTNQN